MKAHATAGLLALCLLGACADPPPEPEPTTPEVPQPEASITAPDARCPGYGEAIGCDAIRVRS